MELIIVGFGPVAGYKYSRCIYDALLGGHLSRYHVVDRESQQQQVKLRLAKLPAQPATCTFIPEEVLQHGPDSGVKWLVQRGVFDRSQTRKKIVITTEPQSHDAYINQALQCNFDVLVAKPIVLPMKDGVLDILAVLPTMEQIARASVDTGANTAVLCLGRLHEVYEWKLRQPIAMMMDRLQTPITSVHVKTASGVWNLPSEFGERNDHPYKYGYGMLMHGAYHYIDILARLLMMNKKLFPDEDFVVVLQGFSAGPYDQKERIGNLAGATSGYKQRFSVLQEGFPYGETDVVASFAMKFRATGQVLCLGTISLEQTTPGMRSWGPFPDVPYNVNGRLHCTDIDVRLGTAFSISANVTKQPIQARHGDADIRGMNSATVITRSNARLTRTQDFVRRETFDRPYGNSFSYSAEGDIFQRWIRDEPTYSDFASHMPSHALLDGLLRLANDSWHGCIEVDFNYPVPDWPPAPDDADPWYAYMDNDVVFSFESKEKTGGGAERLRRSTRAKQRK